MKNTIDQLQKIIGNHSEMLMHISEEHFSNRPAPNKWSKKEELGHLIDSAHNNLRRFMVAQYEDNPKIVYDQNFWVNAGNYQSQSPVILIQLWKSLNLQICEVLKKIPENNFNKSCDIGKGKIELHMLDWLVVDYVKHLLHHMHHILELEAIPY